LRIQAEKERNKLKEEKRKLKYIIGFRQKETTRAKLKKIKEMSEN
jgi:hypothetical protein